MYKRVKVTSQTNIGIKKMKLTQSWIKKQIANYSKMIMDLNGDVGDTKLRTIWSERVNALESVLIVLESEIEAYALQSGK